MCFFLGYKLVLSFFALGGKEIRDFSTRRQRKFAIVIPVHNEEKAIVRTLYSLFGLLYPKNMYDLYVAAYNCTDNTVQLALNMGAKVLERKDKHHNKGMGHDLQWALDRILSQFPEYEAIVVFKSDSLVSGNYLQVMNYYLEQGGHVIQSSLLLLPQPGVWTYEVNRIRILFNNFVKPMGHKVLGVGTGLRDNGICFRADLLRQIPWDTSSVNRSVEYGVVLQMSGELIDFAPEAIIWRRAATHSKDPGSKREFLGQLPLPLIRAYAPKLLVSAFKKRSAVLLNSFIDLVTPSSTKLMTVIFLICIVNGIAWSLEWLPMVYFVMWLSMFVLVFGILYPVIGMIVMSDDIQLLKVVLHLPVNMYRLVKKHVRDPSEKREHRIIEQNEHVNY